MGATGKSAKAQWKKWDGLWALGVFLANPFYVLMSWFPLPPLIPHVSIHQQAIHATQETAMKYDDTVLLQQAVLAATPVTTLLGPPCPSKARLS